MSKPVTLTQFKQYVQSFINTKMDFVVQSKRGVSVVTFAGKVAFISKDRSGDLIKDAVKKRKMLMLFSNVAKNINSFLEKSGLNIEIVKQINSSTYTNHDLFRDMAEGESFNYIDISHCFWRIAFLKGYIKESLYKSVLNKSELKTFRNMALSCIIAPSCKEYYKRGELIATITEDKNLHKIIYDNIRFTAYNLMGDVQRDLGIKVLGFRTDGIMVFPEDAKKVVDYFESKSFYCKNKECFKIDDKHYQNTNGDKKQF